MPEIVYYVASSLDGYIATPDGGVGWLARFGAEDEDYGYAAFYGSVDAVLVGSRTFEQSLTFGEWPFPERPVWVFSSRGLLVDRADVTVTDRGPADVARELDGRGVRRAWLVGGGALAGSFRAAGLITELIVSIMPVILGGGVRLFGGSGPPEWLRLVDEATFADGVLQARYVPSEGG